MERIGAMWHLHKQGYKTFASIEPIVSLDGAKRMIERTMGFCDLFKVGLMSGVKNDYYNDNDLRMFIWWLADLHEKQGVKFYIKDSIRERLGESTVIQAMSVPKDYDIFRREKI